MVAYQMSVDRQLKKAHKLEIMTDNIPLKGMLALVKDTQLPKSMVEMLEVMTELHKMFNENKFRLDANITQLGTRWIVEVTDKNSDGSKLAIIIRDEASNKDKKIKLSAVGIEPDFRFEIDNVTSYKNAFVFGLGLMRTVEQSY